MLSAYVRMAVVAVSVLCYMLRKASMSQKKSHNSTVYLEVYISIAKAPFIMSESVNDFHML